MNLHYILSLCGKIPLSKQETLKDLVDLAVARTLFGYPKLGESSQEYIPHLCFIRIRAMRDLPRISATLVVRYVCQLGLAPALLEVLEPGRDSRFCFIN